MLFHYEKDHGAYCNLAKDYSLNGYLRLQGLADQVLIESCRQYVESNGFKQVFLNAHSQERKWGECLVQETSSLFQTLHNPLLIQFLFRISGLNYSNFSYMKAWINIHQIGEFIDVHTDYGGMQCIICLEHPSPDNGGLLYLKISNYDLPFSFNPGDGFIFNSTQIPHYTSPLIATKECPSPRRMMLVMRYYQKVS